jgi:hypothetical protein
MGLLYSNPMLNLPLLLLLELPEKREVVGGSASPLPPVIVAVPDPIGFVETQDFSNCGAIKLMSY